eukprot:14949426-Alexandrium_andersonii.AAC.1
MGSATRGQAERRPHHSGRLTPWARIEPLQRGPLAPPPSQPPPDGRRAIGENAPGCHCVLTCESQAAP